MSVVMGGGGDFIAKILLLKTEIKFLETQVSMINYHKTFLKKCQ
jgi:hypothetical protein